jgi:hypothetical protein
VISTEKSRIPEKLEELTRGRSDMRFLTINCPNYLATQQTIKKANGSVVYVRWNKNQVAILDE